MEDTVSLRSGLSCMEMSELSRINTSSLDVERDEVSIEKLSGEEKCPVSLHVGGYWTREPCCTSFPSKARSPHALRSVCESDAVFGPHTMLRVEM